MKLSSMHTHTIFCDGKDDIETMCRAAYEKKLFSVGFSAHAPVARRLGKKTDWHLSEDRPEEYAEQVLSAKERWRGRLEIFLGLEVDYIKGIRCAYDSDIKAFNADYLIGALHYVFPENGTEPFTVDSPLEEFNKDFNEGFNGDGDALMHCYYDTMAEMITGGGFDILAHPDIIKKNFRNKKYWSEENELKRQKEIARIVSEAKIVAEINTGGLNRKKTNDTYPSLPFLRFFREYEVPIIITSDAHAAIHIDGNYDNALKTLHSAGFSHHYVFLGRNNGKPLWQKEKIYIRD